MLAKDTFPRRLVQQMDKRSKSSAELARNIGGIPSTILKYRTGRTLPSLDALVQIAIALECSTDYLLGITDEAGNPVPIIEGLDELDREILMLTKALSRDEKKRALDVLRLMTKPL